MNLCYDLLPLQYTELKQQLGKFLAYIFLGCSCIFVVNSKYKQRGKCVVWQGKILENINKSVGGKCKIFDRITEWLKVHSFLK